MRVKRALLSLWNKNGAEKLAIQLQDMGAEIVSTGSTAKYLQQHGVKVTAVEDVTGFPEILDGRVKTLHPKIHGGILAKNSKSHSEQLKELSIDTIDLVAVNLYPFTEIVKKSRDNLRPSVRKH